MVSCRTGPGSQGGQEGGSQGEEGGGDNRVRQGGGFGGGASFNIFKLKTNTNKNCRYPGIE